AAELGLPIVLQAGSDGGTDIPAAPAGGGPIATFGEYRALMSGVLMVHVVSMICQGVFDKYRDLDLLIVGGGIGWVPFAMWKADFRVKCAPQEVAWLRKQPSEYFVERVRVTTYGLEAPADPSRLAPVLSAIPGLASTLVYASGYPNREWQEPSATS